MKSTLEELVAAPQPLKQPDESQVLWRYMDFTKFYSLLSRESLFFATADSMPDPEEGASIRSNSKAMLRALSDLAGHDPQGHEEEMKQREAYEEFVRKFILLNCWHMNKGESHAMWKVYISSDEGLAIKTTFGKLQSALSNYKQYTMRLGAISYQGKVGEAHWGHFFSKDPCYQYEQEFRASIDIYEKLPRGDDFSKWLKSDVAGSLLRDNGLYIPVDLNGLITEIVVSPKSPSWLSKLIESAAANHKLNARVLSSSIRIR